MTGDMWLVLLAAAGLVGWAVSLAWHPYRPCGRCEGRRGRNIGSRTSAYGRCGKCKGRGEQTRRGAKAVRQMIGRPL